jgi:hypothetical protein
MFLLNQVKVLLTGFVFFVALSAGAMGEDRFAITVSTHDKLVIFGPKGDRVAELAVPTIGQSATAGDVSFQVSYGRDTNGRLSAILSPSETAPAPLHFNVMGKAVDADQAVVTLIFTANLKSVIVDPGYGGSVEVNSHRLRKHTLSDDVIVPRLLAPHPVFANTDTASAPIAVPAPAPAAPEVVASESAPTEADLKNAAQPLAPPMLASELSSSVMVPSDTPAPTSTPTPVATATESNTASTPTVAAGDAAPPTPQTLKLYWAEPVTRPDGTAPDCALDEIKLVEVHGSVTITLPTGEQQPGTEGMTVPSGSSVETADDASAALFMGGVNSARLAPRCDLTINQEYDGSTRKDFVDLRTGAVFSRVGKHDGEVEDYQVRTPEGSTAAETPNMLAFRGTADDIPALRTAMNSGLLSDPRQLLAWNPTSLGAGLLSDVVDPVLGSLKVGGGGSPSTVFYYANGQTVNITTIQAQAQAVQKTNGHNSPNANDPNTILQGIMMTIAPFNSKLATLLNDINGGKATAGELKFYRNLIVLFFQQQVPGIANGLINTYKRSNTLPATAGITATQLALLNDLRLFDVEPATSF